MHPSALHFWGMWTGLVSASAPSRRRGHRPAAFADDAVNCCCHVVRILPLWRNVHPVVLRPNLVPGFEKRVRVPLRDQLAGDERGYDDSIHLDGRYGTSHTLPRQQSTLTNTQTTVTGYYVPSMIAGSILSAISAGLMVKYGANTSTGYWIASLILAGLGFGLGAQQCMMIPQTMLKGADIALGTSVIMFAETLSGAIFLAVCENLFESRLVRELHRLAPTATPLVVIGKGAASLESSMAELYGTEVAAAVLQSYSKALQPVWIVAVVLGALSLVGAVFTEWISVKKDKKKEQGGGKREVISTPVAEDENSA